MLILLCGGEKTAVGFSLEALCSSRAMEVERGGNNY